MADVLTVRLLGADRQPLPDRCDLQLDLIRAGSSPLRVQDLTGYVSPIELRGLLPTELYRVSVQVPRFRPVAELVFGTAPTLDLFCPVDPAWARVEWLPYPYDLTRVLPAEQIDRLDEKPRAGLLNIYAKLSKADLWRDVLTVNEVRGDRIFATVDATLSDVLVQSPAFKPVDGSLHSAPSGFAPAGSFKERWVRLGVLQVTLFTDGTTWEADIDIDDAGGPGHVVQVVDHKVTGRETHPFDIQQTLLFYQDIDPGYRVKT